MFKIEVLRKAEAEDGGETTEKARKVPSSAKLKSLLASGRKMQESVDDLTTEHGTEVREAVKKHGLDKKVFGWIKQMDRMEPEKLKLTLENLALYVDSSGLQARADKATANLALAEGGEEEEEGKEGEEQTGRRPRGGRGRAGKPFPPPGGEAQD